MARVIAERSLCSRDRVGAIIVDVDNKIIAEGYNGPARGFNHTERPCEQWCDRALTKSIDPTKLHDPDYGSCPALHAEANALLMSDRSLRVAGTLYVTSHVCADCAKLIANSGLKTLVVESHGEAGEERRDDRLYEQLVRQGLTVFVNDEDMRFFVTDARNWCLFTEDE